MSKRLPPPAAAEELRAMVERSAQAGGQITLEIDPGETPTETIVELLLALDALHRAYGGPGLVFHIVGT